MFGALIDFAGVAAMVLFVHSRRPVTSRVAAASSN